MLSMTGDLDRQLEISAHIPQSAVRPQPLYGATKQLVLLELTALWEGRMEKGAGKKKQHPDLLQK